MTDVDVRRFGVRWRLGAETDRALAAATFSRLVDHALEPALEEALAPFADELVAVRCVRVPEVVVRSSQDADRWAGQVSAAVAGAVSGGSDDVVRYRSRAAATVDVLTRVVLGDDRRVWAWQALGLWQPTTVGGPLGADAVADLLVADTSCLLAALDAMGALVPELVGLLGADRLWRVAETAWRAAGGREPSLAALSTSALPKAPSAAISAALARPVGRHLLGLLREDSAGGPRLPLLRLSLAALLVAQADPHAVAAGSGAEHVSALLGLSHQNTPGRGRRAAGDPAEPSRSGAPAGSVEESAVGRGDRQVTLPAQTRWAGLLFCLHPLRPLLDPRAAGPGRGDITAGPDLRERVRTSGLPGVLHATGRSLADRAGGALWLPDPPADTDPALLALAGLAPGDGAPRPPEDPSLTDELADLVVAALRVRLGHRLPDLADDELLRVVLIRHGTVESDPGWRRVDLRLDEVSVDLRAAGLDLDPGWLPSLGCVVRFRYV